MAYIYDLADTWNASGTTFTAIKMNVTDTASAAASLLMDLQVGGVSQFRVNKDGEAVFTVKNTGASPTLSVVKSGSTSIGITANSSFSITGTNILLAPSSGPVWLGGLYANIGSSSFDDVRLYRDAASTLALRVSTLPMAFNIYNTFTDASNYERGFMRWVSNVLRLGTEKLGTGTARALEFQVDGTTRMSINTGGSVVANVAFYGATGSTYIGWSNSALMTSPSVGVIRLNNFAETDFNRLQFGGTTSSFPAIKRDTTSLQARLADDSAFTNIQGKLTTDTAYTASVIVPTGYIVLFDSTGTAYKVPAEAL